MCLFAALFYVFPVPGFVEVRTKTEAFGIAHEPAIGGRVDLNRAICIPRVDGTPAHVEIESTTGKVRTVDCESSAARIRRFSSQLILVLARAKSRNDLEVLF